MNLNFELSDDFNRQLAISLPILKMNLDYFTVKFYNYFLKTDAKTLFKDTKLEAQYKMFHGSLMEIITHLDHPESLGNLLDSVIINHKRYGVLPSHIELFNISFMKALQDIFGKDFDLYNNLWYTIINKLMSYFEKGL